MELDEELLDDELDRDLLEELNSRGFGTCQSRLLPKYLTARSLAKVSRRAEFISSFHCFLVDAVQGIVATFRRFILSSKRESSRSRAVGSYSARDSRAAARDAQLRGARRGLTPSTAAAALPLPGPPIRKLALPPLCASSATRAGAELIPGTHPRPNSSPVSGKWGVGWKCHEPTSPSLRSFTPMIDEPRAHRFAGFELTSKRHEYGNAQSICAMGRKEALACPCPRGPGRQDGLRSRRNRPIESD